MRFLPLVLIKQKLLRWTPDRARPEIREWQIGDDVGGEHLWEQGRFQGINSYGLIVFQNYNGLNEIALWRGRNLDLARRARYAAKERYQAMVRASLEPAQPPRPVDWTKSDDPGYTPGQWVN